MYDVPPPARNAIDSINSVDSNQALYTIDDMKIGFIETPKVQDSFSVSLVCEAFDKMNENEKEVLKEESGANA